MSELLITVDDHPLDDGPALSCLTQQEKNFVIAMVLAGGAPNQVQNAAKAAGYADPKYGWRLMRSQKIIAALQEEAGKRLLSGALVGSSVLMELAMGANSSGDMMPVKAELRFKAAKELLAHSGYMPIHRQEIEVKHTTPDQQGMIADIKALAKSLGLDPQKLLGQAGVIDAEYEVISPPLASDNSGLIISEDVNKKDVIAEETWSV